MPLEESLEKDEKVRIPFSPPSIFLLDESIRVSLRPSTVADFIVCQRLIIPQQHYQNIYIRYLKNITMDEPQRIQVILKYVKYCIETKDVKATTFHHKFHPYRRKQSTVDLINRAKEREIIFPPRIYCFYDAEATLVEYRNIPLIDLYEEKKKDPDIYMVTALSGSYSLICFRRGGKNLKLVRCTTPSYPALSTFEQIDITTYNKGYLPPMITPKNWDELDWKIYNERRDPRESSVKIGQKLGVTCQTVLTRYRNILEDCEIWLPFFPLGYPNYVSYVVTLRTEFETGILSELKKLDRSSYIYKFDGTLILTLFFNKYLEIDSFLKMEKKGLIHDLHVSYPVWTHNKLVLSFHGVDFI